MHSKQTTLDRLNQIVNLVCSKKDSDVDLNRWVSKRSDQCGTICCALGWVAHDRLFGGQLTLATRTVSGIPLYVVPVDQHGNEGYGAAASVLFGMTNVAADSQQVDIAANLFTYPGASAYDHQIGPVDDKHVFLARIPQAIIDIEALYDHD